MYEKLRSLCLKPFTLTDFDKIFRHQEEDVAGLVQFIRHNFTHSVRHQRELRKFGFPAKFLSNYDSDSSMYVMHEGMAQDFWSSFNRALSSVLAMPDVTGKIPLFRDFQ